MLGEDRYKQMQTYEQTMGDRWMMQLWEGQFAATGSPLESSQKDQLLALMREERQNSLVPGPSFGELRSSQFLNANQVATLEKAQKQQTELLGVQMKMSRALLGGGGK